MELTMSGWRQVTRAIYQLAKNRRGSVAVQFAVAVVPILGMVGAAVDYSRANQYRANLQAAMDLAVLAGGKDGSSSWTQIASDSFSANVASAASGGSASAPVFSKPTSTTYKGNVTATVPTTFLKILKYETISVGVSATAASSPPDNSCILTLDHGKPTSDVALSLNGAPVVNLSGCSLRSNTSMSCNGHDGNNTAAYAAGSASGCGHPSSGAAVVPDIYTSLASNIQTMCTSYPGASWTPGATPSGSGVKTRSVTVGSSSYTEYHICGDLALSGTGYLTGSSPGADTVVVIENGSLNVANGASISAARTALVLTGDNSVASQINFPNGNGKSATLNLSPPTGVDNPWQSVALYQNPNLTKLVDEKWGPGADFSANGLVYLPNANVVTDGNMGSANSQCSKFVMNTLTTNGSVNLDMDQSIPACSALGLKQWTGIVVYLSN
jgi:Flp pilus assembly protein TadG